MRTVRWLIWLAWLALAGVGFAAAGSLGLLIVAALCVLYHVLRPQRAAGAVTPQQLAADLDQRNSAMAAAIFDRASKAPGAKEAPKSTAKPGSAVR